METDFKHFIYVDKEALYDIYCQLPDSELSARITKTDYVDGDIKAKLGTKAFSRIISGELSANVGTRHEIQEEKEMEIRPYDMVNTILESEFDGKADTLFEVLNEYGHFTTKLIACKGIFRFVRAFDEKKGRFLLETEIKNNPVGNENLLFYFASVDNIMAYDSNRDLSEMAENNNEAYVELFFSRMHLTRGVRHLTNNIRYNKHFLFYLIGEITSMGNKIYNIKPYVIWRMTDNNM